MPDSSLSEEIYAPLETPQLVRVTVARACRVVGDRSGDQATATILSISLHRSPGVDPSRYFLRRCSQSFILRRSCPEKADSSLVRVSLDDGVANADPAKKAKVSAEMGIRITYEPAADS
jgi:hypothetical protein